MEAFLPARKSQPSVIECFHSSSFLRSEHSQADRPPSCVTKQQKLHSQGFSRPNGNSTSNVTVHTAPEEEDYVQETRFKA